MGSGEAVGAEAGGRVPWDAHAGAAVETGSGRTSVRRPVAIAPFISRGAGADIVIDAVVARAAVSTGVVCAVVDVDLAALASETRSTAAHANTPQDHTQAIIGTRQSRAFVHSSLAVQTRVASGTVTCVTAPIIFLVASAAMKARGVCAGEQTVFTVISLKARQTGADVTFVKIRAKTSIHAWAAVTFAHLKLAVDPSVTRPTGAGVTALTCIHTCGSIHTWLVMCAKIQILVTEQSTPALFTVALPWLLTGAVFTGWIFPALCAKFSLPSFSAHTLSRFGAIAIRLTASLQTDRFFAVLPLPARETG